MKKLLNWIGIAAAYLVISAVGAYALLGFFCYWD